MLWDHPQAEGPWMRRLWRRRGGGGGHGLEGGGGVQNENK